MKNVNLKISKLKILPLRKRRAKVKVKDFAKPILPPVGVEKFIGCLPNILAARDFKEVVAAIKRARKKRRLILFMLGAHVIKCGLAPILIDLMKKGFIGGIAMNGAAAIHDFEIAFCGRTSEEVKETIKDGSFGMSIETATYLNNAVKKAASGDLGIGEAFGKMILTENLPFRQLSLLANAAKLNVPLTVHVAIGTDTIHAHPDCDGAALGKASLHDFHRFVNGLRQLEGGVVLNVGSAVIMPEVFLKAVSVVRNLGTKLNDFTAVCFDMIKHYRPLVNVVERPTATGGKGYYIIGHHELMIPLLYLALIN